MGYQILHTPYLLYETVELLYKYTNGISFRSLLFPRLEADCCEDRERVMRQAEVLQTVIEAVCRWQEPHDPLLLKYFGRIDLKGNQDGTCLARLMTFSFLSLEETDFQKSVELIRANWHHLQRQGAWIENFSIMGLEFNRETPASGDLLDQICALELPAKVQLDLYRTLRDFDLSLDELSGLMEPVARRLADQLPRIEAILSERAGYWESASVTPVQYAEDTAGTKLVLRPEEQTKVAFLAMNHNFLLFRQADLSPDQNYLYIGFGAGVSSRQRDQVVNYEMMSLALKALSDKKRLEILGRLSRERVYSQELAQVMNMDPSNMSRSLALLCNHGFLQQEKEGQRNFYRTDSNAVRRFLRQLERVLLE